MANQYVNRSAKLGFLQQSKQSNHWTAPNDATSNYKLINADVGITYDSGVVVDETNATGSGRLMSEQDRKYVDSTSGLPSITYTAVATKALLADHLVAAFQKVTEAETPPYTKQISPVNAFVDFANNSGYLWTLAFTPSGDAVADSILLKNALLDSFEFSIDNLANGHKQLAQIACTWKGNEITFDNNLSGTLIAAPTSGFFNTANLGFTLDLTIGSDAFAASCWRRFSMKMVNNVFNLCPTTGGKANQYGLNPELTFTIDIPYTSSNYVILGNYKSGDNVNVNLYNGVGTSDGELNINFPNGILTRDPFTYEGDYSAMRLEIKAQAPTAGFSTSAIKFTDSIDGGY